jgi:hypothetical protein
MAGWVRVCQGRRQGRCTGGEGKGEEDGLVAHMHVYRDEFEIL